MSEEEQQEYIYCVTNTVSGKAYVGRTNNPNRRMGEHMAGRGGAPYLRNSIKKHGAASFEFRIIDSAPVSGIEELEQRHIKRLGTIAPKGYNLREGGTGGRMHPDTIFKLSAAGGRVHKPETLAKRSGSKHFRYGKPRTDCKPIAQYDAATGSLITSFSGVRAALESVLGQKLDGEALPQRACCNMVAAATGAGGQKSAFGFAWRYTEGSPALAITPVVRKKHAFTRSVSQHDVFGVTIATHASISDAAKAIGANQSNISACLRGKANTCKGFEFRYVGVCNGQD